MQTYTKNSATKTFTVVCRAQNSWTRDNKGEDYRTIIHTCGHLHRTLAGATKCLATLKGTTLSLTANIETYAKYQQFYGVVVRPD